MSSTTKAIYKALKQKYRTKFPNGTPFIVACGKGSVEDVKDMIRGASAAGEDIKAMVNQKGRDTRGFTGYTPLLAAAEYERSTIVEILLQNNADTAITNNGRKNALHYAARFNKTNTTTVRLLLDNMKLEDINMDFNNGSTPLDWCYRYNRSSIKQQLIDLIREKGGKKTSDFIIERYNKDYPLGTPFVVACQLGNESDVNSLIEGIVLFLPGWDMMDDTIMDKVGTNSRGVSMTPLMAAALNEHSNIIDILLNFKVDTATTTEDGFNALHIAAAANTRTTTTVGLLLRNMKLEDINHKTILGETPLDFCIRFNDSPIKQQLIDLIREKGGKRGDNGDQNQKADEMDVVQHLKF